MIKKEDIGIILSICVILYLIYDKFCAKSTSIEHMTDINTEALSNLASMYASGKMIVDEIEVQNDINVKGNVNIKGENTVEGKSNLEGNVHTGQVIMGNTKLSSGANTSLKVQTSHGWGEFGPQNTEWMHIMTDRGKVYINKRTNVDGMIATHNKDGIDDTRRLKTWSRIGGYAKDGNEVNILLQEGSHKLHDNRDGLYTYATKDRWDIVYVFKGWKFIGYDGLNYDGTSWVLENKTDYVKHMGGNNDTGSVNKIHSYKLQWVGY